MDIRSVEIDGITGGGFQCSTEGVRHTKAMPRLSVVQSVHGRYDIALEDGDVATTEQGGAFVAPANVMQHIVHHDGEGGYMEAQWAFMHVTVNGTFELTDVFELPLLLSSEHSAVLSECIGIIRQGESICQTYAAAYRLTELLLSRSTPRDACPDERVLLLKRYIERNYGEKITKEELAGVAFCSVANLYRIFERHFGLSPHNYINKIRLERAALLLESDRLPITEIARGVGFEDPAYFSRLFNRRYLCSPGDYRSRSRLGMLPKIET